MFLWIQYANIYAKTAQELNLHGMQTLLAVWVLLERQ